MITNQWGGSSIAYMGMDQITKKWQRIDTYGGKLVENIVQGISRDCLFEAIEKLVATGYTIVTHVHDEILIECPVDRANLEEITKIITQPLPWAPGLPLRAAGWIGDFYRKD
jgi:DNA polymerase